MALTDITRLLIDPDKYHVSPEPILMVATLSGGLALSLYDKSRRVGGMLHLRFMGTGGRPSDVTDNTANSVLVILERFKRGVIGNAARVEEIEARIIAHALPPTGVGEPTANLVDLIRAALAHDKIGCGTQMTRRTDPVTVCFQPVEGRIWIEN
ncbi:MAG: hypothetical protein M3O06_04505, partial [Pseudomonadota bacterium]|nr:hypothetical protein [Pseudomonadota bacterium]